MNPDIVVAVITSVASLIGTIISVIVGMATTAKKAAVQQAITDTKLEELTREVRLHNNFAARMPVVEEKIKVINHRIDDLEEGNKNAKSK